MATLPRLLPPSMQGQLFSQDFLLRGIQETPPWQNLADAEFDAFEAALRGIFVGLDGHSTINEAQTEQLVIERVLREIGWADDYLPQVNLSGKRREDVPDILLFPDSAAKARAIAESKDDRRYRHGLAILEAKRWLRPLDRGESGDATDPGAPSSQMLRYLSRVDVVSDRRMKWGVLSNGGVWRLYWQDARSRAEEFFEIDLAALLGIAGTQRELDGFEPAHGLRLFFLLFHRAAFLTQAWDDANRSFHAYARNEARLYEEKVSQDLGARVFGEIFPQLAQALARGDLQAAKQKTGYGQFTRQQFTREYLDEVREAALILLYRLLFLFYAEDRNLLPVRDARYHAYSVRRLRERVRDDKDAGKPLSTRLDNIWRDLQGAFQLIDEGDDAVGMPAYNGGLFDRARAPLLERTRVPDAVMAPIVDALSRRTEDLLHAWINYRDLSVSHLGGIYERLLEYTLVHEVQAADDYHDKPEIDRIVARPASFARKVSGSYYTHDDLVRLILRESVGLLARERVEGFDKQIAKWARKTSLNPAEWDTLDRLDPASRILDLKVCDPAMGSGHFLVALVDDLADRVLEAIDSAEHAVAEQRWSAHLVEQGRPWQSPLVARIADIRRTIRGTAREHGWAVTDAQLDDRHIVRRMILKKTIFGVDKNPMAVELAKTALWLHTFTVGAPLSFLDHHLRCGDSLHGELLKTVQLGVNALGMMFQQAELARLERAARSLTQVAEFTDVDIAEAQLSKKLSADADAEVAPLHALLDFWRAMRWLLPGWPVDASKKLSKLGDETQRLALQELLSPERNLLAVLAAGSIEGAGAAVAAANALLAQARALAARECFFHWWTAFPTVFKADGGGGFDAVIGNPPWDRIKLQEVEWFAEREPAIAMQARAADRKALIAAQRKKGSLLAAQYAEATERADANARVLGKSGDYPLLGGGDVNLYSLFVERAQSLADPAGLVALLTPSGIAADKGAAVFFKSIATTQRLGALFDFENKGVFFPDVHDNFKFVALTFGGEQRKFDKTRCAYYLHGIGELDDADRVLELTAANFALVNPNTGAAPIFRNRRDANLTMRLYSTHPVLVKHGEQNESLGVQPDRKVWPVKYATMFHMTNDSGLFMTRAALVKQGFEPIALNRWRKGDVDALPLLVGKTIWHFDHRANHASVNAANVQVASSSRPVTGAERSDPSFVPEPQYWVVAAQDAPERKWAIGFRDITNPTNSRTAIAAIVPYRLAGNTLPLLVPDEHGRSPAEWSPLLLANLNCLAFDYVTRQKAKWTHLNWFILEQLPVIAPERFEASIGGVKIADFIREQVLHLSYTAHDLAPFARDLGHVHADGSVKPPFVWNDEDRRARMAALDGLFMHLYGLDEADAAYILDTFQIVRVQDESAFGRFRTKEDVIAALQRISKDVLAV
ncbi:MAG: Eco57I restriction-modification methylase domain-containing protein [Rubrivivax sp.]|nr:Eco57I restriction-modification methylase domain-containing protein [Rubrivivax sp.]